MALVSPYYSNGNVAKYLKGHPTANIHRLVRGAPRSQLLMHISSMLMHVVSMLYAQLNEVAQGLLYLHTRSPPVVHQDLRGVSAYPTQPHRVSRSNRLM